MFNQDIPYINRNEARNILLSLAKYNAIRSTSIFDLCAYVILFFQKKYNLSYVTFIFTNALVDMFPDANVEDENTIHFMIAIKKVSVTDIEYFFERHLGTTLENLMTFISKEEMEYKVELVNSGDLTYDILWFNNSNEYIFPLLSAYQNFKKEKSMLFQNNDIKQIAIDYSVVLCFNHFAQRGFLNKSICSAIIKKLTDETNNCLNTGDLSYDSLMFDVFNDLSNPKSIKVALDFIKQL